MYNPTVFIVKNELFPLKFSREQQAIYPYYGKIIQETKSTHNCSCCKKTIDIGCSAMITTIKYFSNKHFTKYFCTSCFKIQKLWGK